MPLTLRPFRRQDRADILALVRRFSEFEVGPWRTREQIDEANLATLSESLDHPFKDEAVWVAEQDGRFAGFVHVRCRTDHFTGERVGYVDDLAVPADSEGTGAAARLLDQAVDWARGEGLRLLTLDVFEGNERAKRLYEKHGFRPDIAQYTRFV